MMLQSILGDALTLGNQAAAAFKPLAQTTTSTVTSTITTVTTAVTNPLATATSAITSPLATATSAISNAVAAATPTSAVLNNITPATAPTAVAASGGSFGLHNPLDWGWLTTYPDIAMGPFAWLFFLICLVVFVGSIYFLVIARNRYRDSNSLNYRVINKYAPWFLGVSAAGLFFVLLRLPIWPGTKLDPVTNTLMPGSFEYGGQRIWFYLIFLTLIGFAIWFFRYYPTKYRADLADWQKRAVKRQYDPTAVRRVGATTTPGGSPTGVKRRPRR